MSGGTANAAVPVSVTLRVDNFNNYSRDDIHDLASVFADELQEQVSRRKMVFG